MFTNVNPRKQTTVIKLTNFGVFFFTTDCTFKRRSFCDISVIICFLFSATKLSKECHPVPQPCREAMLSSHPTPNYIVLTPASCSLGLVVSVLAKLCNVVGGSSVECYSFVGGMGCRIPSSDLLLKHRQTDKACLEHWFLLGSICTHCSPWLLQYDPAGAKNAWYTPQPTFTAMISLGLVIQRAVCDLSKNRTTAQHGNQMMIYKKSQ